MSITDTEAPVQLTLLGAGHEAPSTAGDYDAAADLREQLRTGQKVDLAKRALFLLKALDCCSQAVRLENLVERWHYDYSLQSRYDTDTIERMARIARDAADAGRTNFGFSGNMYALDNAGYDADEINRITEEDFQEFKDTYVGSGNRSAREKYKRRLNKMKDAA